MLDRRTLLVAAGCAALMPRAHAHERQLDPRFQRQALRNPTGEPAGTVVVATSQFFLYFVLPDGMALRYGVGVGAEGLAWRGVAEIGRKAQWPRWTPPRDMIRRKPTLAKWHHGMPGGPGNPLGARALYLFKDGRDTLYRIHGTNEPWTIGTAASSGCVRLTNPDIMNLYTMVPLGTRVVIG